MYPRFFMSFIIPLFLAQSRRVYFISPTNRGSFKCEWKCFNAPLPNNYHVQVSHGQKVFFKREPDNSNDPNAIVVCTYERNIIGHLKKNDAAFYSRFLNFDTCVFGFLTRKAHGKYQTSMVVEKIIESPKYAIFNQSSF